MSCPLYGKVKVSRKQSEYRQLAATHAISSKIKNR